jgi:hypothetical protein
MAKTLLVFFFQFFLHLFTLGQTDSLSSKMSISFVLGTAIPEGEFRNLQNNFTYDFHGSIAGGAKIGIYGKLDFQYLLHKNFGLITSLYSTMNNSKVPEDNEYNLPHSNALGGGFVITSNSYDTKQWYANSALIGIYATASIKLISLDFKLSAGIQQVKSPIAHKYYSGYNWIGGTKTGTFYSSETQPNFISYNFVANIGMDCKMKMTKSFSAKIGIENLFSQGNFDGDLIYTTVTNKADGTTSNNESQDKRGFTKNVFIMGLNAGITYSINMQKKRKGK